MSLGALMVTPPGPVVLEDEDATRSPIVVVWPSVGLELFVDEGEARWSFAWLRKWWPASIGDA